MIPKKVVFEPPSLFRKGDAKSGRLWGSRKEKKKIGAEIRT